MTAALAIALLAALLGACGSGGDGVETTRIAPQSASGPASDAERVTIPGGGEVLVWGEGRDAVLLVHGAIFDAASWQPQARRIAEEGKLVVALERIAPEDILAAVEYLRAERSARTVALIGASAGADASLQLLASRPAVVDRLITLSVNSTAEGLGPQPKLFIASEDEPVADLSVELAESSPGDDNEALLLPGSAHAQGIFDSNEGGAAMRAILDQLSE